VTISLPCKDPSDASTIIECNEFQRIEQAARIITPEERAAAAEKVRLEKEHLSVGDSFVLLGIIYIRRVF